MLYRPLFRKEIAQLGEIDRREVIEKIYYLRDGKLILENEHYDVKGWHPEELKQLILRVEDIYDRGGTVYGALDESRIVGMLALDNHFFGSRQNQLKLDILYIDLDYRKRGIGQKLMELTSTIARELGAGQLYISATPSENTVNFYMRLGAELATEIDPDLYALEPDDIHLQLQL